MTIKMTATRPQTKIIFFTILAIVAGRSSSTGLSGQPNALRSSSSVVVSQASLGSEVLEALELFVPPLPVTTLLLAA